jgi:uncharacterized protein (TIGR02301 family)
VAATFSRKGRRIAGNILASVSVIGFLAACPAGAQARGADDRQALADLARVLGESHALRQICEGAGDQTWRDRMQALLEIETPDADLKTRLAQAFNSGFDAGRTGFPACGKASRTEAARVAVRGEALAIRLGAP